MESANDEQAREPGILFEDAEILVIDKPAGMAAHPDGRTRAETVSEWFVRRAPEARGVGEPLVLQDGTRIGRPGIVHRLDRETSGVMVLAKTQEAHAFLKRQFHGRTAEKEYRAFVYGTMAEQYGSVDRPIGRSARDPRRRSAEPGARGTLRDAKTEWERISQNERFAYLRLMPKTGRTHQLRVHLKAISRPIVGDTLYAPSALLAGENLGFDRLALHAHTLTLEMRNGERRTFTAPLPPKFVRAAERIAL
jgi:23S rRNA pseudouridine1911/1915/1917 synthase